MPNEIFRTKNYFRNQLNLIFNFAGLSAYPCAFRPTVSHFFLCIFCLLNGQNMKYMAYCRDIFGLFGAEIST